MDWMRIIEGIKGDKELDKLIKERINSKQASGCFAPKYYSKLYNEEFNKIKEVLIDMKRSIRG